MFLHLYKYRLKVLLRKKVLMFWCLAFPMVLGTLFYLAFGRATDNYETFKSISVQVVSDGSEAGNHLLDTMKSIEIEDGVPMFNVTENERNEAEKLLMDKKTNAVILASANPELLVKGSGMNQTIIKSFLSQYQRTIKLYSDIAVVNPAAIEKISELMAEDVTYLREVTLGGEKMDSAIQYFFALLAMTCLYGGFLGVQNAEDILANVSPLGARRHIAPTHHLKQVLADMLAAFTLHFVNILLVVAFLKLVFKIQLLDQPVYFILVCFCGGVIGVTIGQFIGCVARKSEGARIAILLTFSMAMSMLSGMMFAEMKYIIDNNAPIVNRLNPAALISEAFYCLSVYSDYTRFFSNLVILLVMTVVMLFGCFFLQRRSKYASI